MTQQIKILEKYRESYKDDIAIVIHANKGLKADTFFELVNVSGINKQILAEEIFDISLKTLMRYKTERKKLNPRNSEIVLKLFSLFYQGNDLFGSLESFTVWLNKPAYGLGDQIPFKLMNTSTGIDLVEDELNRIEHGILA